MDQLALFAAPSHCSVEGCKRLIKQKSLRLCGPHYKRHWKYGSATAGGPERPRARAGKPVQDFPDGTRICNNCGERKPLEQFNRDAGGTAGRRSHCAICHTGRATDWYLANQERQQRRQRERRDRNLDRYRELDRERYERDKPKRIALVTEAVHRRRALMRQVEWEPGITVRALRKRHGDKCCYCGEVMTFAAGKGRAFVPLKATIEHIVALAKGGGHTWANTTLACWQCNVRKNAKSLDEWLASTQIDDESVA